MPDDSTEDFDKWLAEKGYARIGQRYAEIELTAAGEIWRWLSERPTAVLVTAMRVMSRRGGPEEGASWDIYEHPVTKTHTRSRETADAWLDDLDGTKPAELSLGCPPPPTHYCKHCGQPFFSGYGLKNTETHHLCPDVPSPQRVPSAGSEAHILLDALVNAAAVLDGTHWDSARGRARVARRLWQYQLPADIWQFYLLPTTAELPIAEL